MSTSSINPTNEEQCVRTTLTIPAAVDQYPITATMFEPKAEPKNSIVVILMGATGVPQRFYAAYSQFLAKEGFCRVFTLDYRGIGLSKPKQGLKGFKASIIPEWRNDVLGVVRYISQHWSESKKVMICHSVGGHLAPMIPGICRYLFFGVGTAYIEQLPLGYLQRLLFSKLGPTIASVFRHFPSHLLGLGEPLPQGAGTQWTTWSRTRLYHTVLPEVVKSYTECTTPVLSVLFTNDTLCSHPNFIDFLSFLPNTHRSAHLHPSPIGHIDFFRASSKSLWPLSLPWILHGQHVFGDTQSLHVQPGVGGLAWADTVMKEYNARKAKL